MAIQFSIGTTTGADSVRFQMMDDANNHWMAVAVSDPEELRAFAATLLNLADWLDTRAVDGKDEAA